uniref:Uncharacterized protein n=1 Tax=Amphimedon queenslandica TaxID=400682 RepID=A0A1X7V6N7_AMPQE
LVDQFFKSLVSNGYFHIHLSYHLDIARYCFSRIIQDELNQFSKEWNSHRIRPSKHADAPAGIPDVMYSFPSLTETSDYTSRVDSRILNILKDEFYCKDSNYVSNNFERLAE